MRQHRVIVGKVELADHAHRLMPGLNAGKLDALLGMKQLAAGEFRQKIEMPPGAAKLAVGRKLQTGRGLPVHDLLDLHVLGLSQLVSRDLAFLEPGAGFLDALWPQQAADLVRTEGGLCSLHGFAPPKLTSFARIRSFLIRHCEERERRSNVTTYFPLAKQTSMTGISR